MTCTKYDLPPRWLAEYAKSFGERFLIIVAPDGSRVLVDFLDRCVRLGQSFYGKGIGRGEYSGRNYRKRLVARAVEELQKI